MKHVIHLIDKSQFTLFQYNYITNVMYKIKKRYLFMKIKKIWHALSNLKYQQILNI